MSESAEDELMTIAEAADLHGVSRQAIYDAVKRLGMGVVARRTSKRFVMMVRRSDVLAYEPRSYRDGP